jgi:hypothetical protein
MMKGAALSFPDAPCWSKLYAEALFETDRSRLRERIAEAEKAIVARAGELFNTTTTISRKFRQSRMLYMSLRALQTCLGIEAAAA